MKKIGKTRSESNSREVASKLWAETVASCSWIGLWAPARSRGPPIAHPSLDTPFWWPGSEILRFLAVPWSSTWKQIYNIKKNNHMYEGSFSGIFPPYAKFIFWISFSSPIENILIIDIFWMKFFTRFDKIKFKINFVG